jgi:hypothetical protein
VCTTLRNMAIPRDASRRLPDSVYCKKTPTFGFKTAPLTSLASSRPCGRRVPSGDIRRSGQHDKSLERPTERPAGPSVEGFISRFGLPVPLKKWRVHANEHEQWARSRSPP